MARRIILKWLAGDTFGGGVLPIFVFPVVAGLFGLLLVLITPPFQSPDEPAHFFRAYQVSEGRLFPELQDSRAGGCLPASLSAVSDSFSPLRHERARLLPGQTRRLLAVPLHPELVVFTDFANTAMYAPMAYLPQAAGIACARLLGASALQMLYAARLGNLLVWVLLLSVTIRIAGRRGVFFALPALLPAVLFMSASANADVLTNGLCWWLVAALLSGQYRRVWVIAGFAVVSVNKLITFPLALLARLGGASYRSTAMLVAASLLGALCWGAVAKDWFIPYDAYHPLFRDGQTLNTGVNPGAQLEYVLNNPLKFVATAVTSLFYSLPATAAHFVGKFGWEKNYIPVGWTAALWLVLTAVLCTEERPLPLRRRWLPGVVVVAYVAGFALTNYLLWNAVGADRMDNWQGRYFIAVAPVAGLLPGNSLLLPWRRQIFGGGLVLVVLSNVSMLCSLIDRYY